MCICLANINKTLQILPLCHYGKFGSCDGLVAIYNIKGPVNIYWGVGTGAFWISIVKKVYILS